MYLAERSDGQFEQTVAIKVVQQRTGLSDRLRHERQIIATLRHPHIVSLVDGGETESGAQWFAMALVDGVPLDRYVRDRGLAWREVLRLFDQVAAALTYAHDRGLIHRDLKPANILVDNEGHPRLLDFGIALEGGQNDGSNDRVLTPGYASPEQNHGKPITTASDLYQLGLILAQLLGFDVPPGARTERLPHRVDRDLRRVLARATATEPEARHASVAALREDLCAVLECRPIAEDRDRLGVRLRRLTERHRLAVSIAALALLTLMIVLATATWQLREERNQALANEQRANAVAAFLVETLSQANPYADKKGAVSVIGAMDQAAKKLDAHLEDAPEVRRELRTTVGQVYLNLDEPQRCLDLLATTRAETDSKGATAAQQGRYWILRSECLLALDERDAANQMLDRAEQAIHQSSGPDVDRIRAWIMVDRAQILSLNGRLRETETLLRQALALSIQINDIEQQYRSYRFLGGVASNSNRQVEAAELFGKSHAAAVKTLGIGHRSTLTVAGQWALALSWSNQNEQAIRLIEDNLQIARSVKHRDAGAEIVMAQLLDNRAGIYWAMNRSGDCIKDARASYAIYQRLAAPGSSQGFNPAWRSATCAYQMHDWAHARDYASEALVYAKNGVSVGVVNSFRMLASVAVEEGDLSRARSYLDQAYEALKRAEVGNPSVFSALDLVEAKLAAASLDRVQAELWLKKADARIAESNVMTGWLPEERDWVAKRIAALPAP